MKGHRYTLGDRSSAKILVAATILATVGPLTPFGQWPADTTITPVTRTIGQGRVIDELLMRFTHDVVVDAFLPGVAPTGRKVEIVVVVICGTEGGKVAFERIYWDQASVLVQLGLLSAEGLPVTGAEQARKVIDATLSANGLLCAN